MIAAIELLLSVDVLHPILVVKRRDSSKVGNWQPLRQFRLLSYFLFLPHTRKWST